MSKRYKIGRSVTHLEYPKRCAEVFICPHGRRHDHYSLQGLSFSLILLSPHPEHTILSLSLFFRLSASLVYPFDHKHRVPAAFKQRQQRTTRDSVSQ